MRLQVLYSDIVRDIPSSSGQSLYDMHLELHHNMDVYSQALSSSNSSTLRNYCDTATPNTILSSSKFADGLSSASHRYLANECHEEVPNFSVGSSGNDMLWAKDVSVPNLPQSIAPNGETINSKPYTEFLSRHVLQNNSDEVRFSMSQMPSSYRIPNESLDGILAFTTNTMQELMGGATPDLYMDSHLYGNFPIPLEVNIKQIGQSPPGETHMMPDCQLSASGNLNIPSGSQCNLNMNPAELYHYMNVQTAQEAPQVPEGRAQLFQMDTIREHLLQSRLLNEEIQPSLRRSHQPYEQFNQNQHWQQEQFHHQNQAPSSIREHLLQPKLPNEEIHPSLRRSHQPYEQLNQNQHWQQEQFHHQNREPSSIRGHLLQSRLPNEEKIQPSLRRSHQPYEQFNQNQHRQQEQFHYQNQAPSSIREHLLQSRLPNEEIQPSLGRSHQPYEQFNQNQHWKKEQFHYQNQAPSSIREDLLQSRLPNEEIHSQPYEQFNQNQHWQQEQFHYQNQAPSSIREHLLQYRLPNEEIQPTLGRSHQPYEQFNQNQHWQQEQFQHQKQVLVENNTSGLPQEESIFNQPIQMNGYIPPEQGPHVPQTGSIGHRHSAPCGVAVSYRTGLTRGYIKYRIKLYILYQHVKNCSCQEQECQHACCATVKRTLNQIFQQKQNLDIEILFNHYRFCPEPGCLVCYPVRVELMMASISSTRLSPGGLLQVSQVVSSSVTTRTETAEMEAKSCARSTSESFAKLYESTFDIPEVAIKVDSVVEPVILEEIVAHCEQENMHAQMEVDKVELEENCQIAAPIRVGMMRAAIPTIDTVEHLQRFAKHRKRDHSSISSSCQYGTYKVSLPLMDHNHRTHSSPGGMLQVSQQVSTSVTTRTETGEMEVTSCARSTPESSEKLYESTFEVPDVAINVDSVVEPVIPEEIVAHCEQGNMHTQMEVDKVELEENCQISAPAAARVTRMNLGKPKAESVCLIDSFTKEQVEEHIRSLRQCDGQSTSKAEDNQGMEHSPDTDSCSLCGMAELSFKPPPRYCASCSRYISPRTTYYSIGSINTTDNADNAQKSFCGKCHNVPGGSIKVACVEIPKAWLKMRLNDAENELWVQCNKCNAWQHQICALFNGKMNKDEETEYTCPNCFLKEIESGKHELLPRSTVLGAKDLPKTMLSNHIEQRLFKRLTQERQERAKRSGETFDEVPGVEDLVVRVVSSVDRKLNVKQLFREIVQEEKYPAEFPYKSKAILLFQKIQGADVCLFSMYVQEFGSDCAYPNQRHVCLSYLDSVKYFKPEIKTVTGEALRTFVYHEILIGYLDYCKKRGFTTLYIWSCPPVKEDNYILFCHPEIQKTPNALQLRDWYRELIRKATEESIVVNCTNLYDHFFKHTGKCKTKVTAASLPYFEGDFWPGEAEKLLQQEDGSMPQKKRKKAAIERDQRAAQRDTSTGDLKDVLLMHHLGKSIHPQKEDFIIVHLQYDCRHCHQLIVSRRRWVCNVCKNFQLCEKCHDTKQTLDMKEKHSLCQVEMDNMPADINDKDEIMENYIFDTRTACLSLCKRNNYQFDTLRQAKHSTMMILYHLHNPTAPVF